MKLTLFLFLVSMLAAFADARAQRINLSVKQAPLQKVLIELSKQSAYTFVYSDDLLEGKNTVTIDLVNKTLAESLDQLLKPLALTYQIKGESIAIKRQAVRKSNGADLGENPTQQQPIRGRVTNEKGEALVGASIYVLDDQGKRTMMQTKTDEEGYFEIKQVEAGTKLEVVFLGYTAQKLTVRADMGTIVLKPFSAEVEEVEVMVNTGYQQLPKERATGSFDFIDNKKLNEQVGTNILQRLDGIASGVLFDTKKPSQERRTNITVRGLSTIHGPLDPLIVLDGFPFEGNLENINPNDIENITILKDAAAASIWGARAGNGVIILTSKKGKFNQPLQVGFNSNIIVSEKPDLLGIPQISSADYVDFEKFIFEHGYFNSTLTNITQNGLTPVVEIMQKMAAGSLSQEEGDRQLSLLKNTDSREQFMRYMYQSPVTQQYSLNLRGGSDNLAWIISGNYDKGVSELSAKNDKLNFRFDNTYRPLKALKINVGVYYTQQTSQTGKPGFNSITTGGRTYPYMGFVDELGNPIPVATTLRHSYTDTAGMGKLLDWKYYPLEDYKHNANTVKRDEIVANVGVNYMLMKGLNLDVKYQYQIQRVDSENYMDIESFQTRDLINRFSQLNRNTGVVAYIVPLGGVLSGSDEKIHSYNSRAQLNYQTSWSERHQVNALMGAEIRQVRQNYGTRASFGHGKDPLFYGKVDQVNSYPDFVTGWATNIAPYVSPTFISKTNRFVSAFANFSYIYAGKYILSGSMRNDASNIFGVDYQNKWKPLLSVGGAWELSKEPFYNWNSFPYVKLRATYGHSGNVDPSKTSRIVGRITKSSYTPFTLFSIQPDLPPNPDLRWEKVTTVNLALEFVSKNDRVSGSLEWYNKRGHDLYGRVYYDYTAWGTSPTMLYNAATSDGRGFDLTLTSKNLTSDRFLWQTTLLASRNISKTLQYNSPTANKPMSGLSMSGSDIMPIPGYPMYAIAAYRWAGLDSQGNPQGYVNGQPTTDYNAINVERWGMTTGQEGNTLFIGSSIPTVFGNFNSTFQYRDLSLSVNFTYKLGYYFRKPTLNYYDLQQGGANNTQYNNADYSLRWQKPGDELITQIPSFVYPINSSRDYFYHGAEIHVMRGDHIRLQYVHLNYALPLVKSSNNRMRHVDIYANLSNLGVVWKANPAGLDPENIGNPSVPIQYAFGLRANF
ncbi:TonB-linked SusC/RagA family outer membrane protein [Sphingobacterium yanglingense]|uniref:TonB-linked SusC/RagA family outer membrane protein n=2 Tax=Sphingobacterium yanglingense TaxID=1437280 RepID=A0A4R6WGK9_9SPHI|nr:TonB-linked SusC/RagA family outer membrane protein [Sphingobacterium yanglingense]